MKIGHCVWGMSHKGGVASYIQRISESQRQQGHGIVYLDGNVDEVQSDAQESIEYVTSDLYERAGKLGIDILHMHGGWALPKSIPVPTIRTLHGHQPYCPSGSRFLKRQGKPCNYSYNPARCALHHLVDGCGSVRPAQMLTGFRHTRGEMQTLRRIPTITVSHFLKAQMLRAGYPEHLIHVLHLPAPEVRTYMPPPLEGLPHFLFLGRITPQKGVAWLLRAVQAVRLPIHVDIAGEGQDEIPMRQLAQSLGLESRVTFHGWVDNKQVNALLTKSRALVFPSVWHEPAGLVSLDAMINGRAVIASRVGGIPEVVEDGINGLLVEPNDVSALAHAMECLAQDWPLAQQLGLAGYEVVAQKYSMKSHIDTLMKLYHRQIKSEFLLS